MNVSSTQKGWPVWSGSGTTKSITFFMTFPHQEYDCCQETQLWRCKVIQSLPRLTSMQHDQQTLQQSMQNWTSASTPKKQDDSMTWTTCCPDPYILHHPLTGTMKHPMKFIGHKFSCAYFTPMSLFQNNLLLSWSPCPINDPNSWRTRQHNISPSCS